jgi:hypothetical protein
MMMRSSGNLKACVAYTCLDLGELPLQEVWIKPGMSINSLMIMSAFWTMLM